MFTPASWPNPSVPASYWLTLDEKNPFSSVGKDAPLPPKVGTTVIGSGITGVCFVWELVKMLETREDLRRKGLKFKIAILEARDFCSGATGRNAGNFVPIGFMGFAERAEEYARRAAELEDYATGKIREFVSEKGIAHEIDLADDGVVFFFETEQQKALFEKDIEGATTAGRKDDKNIQWLNEDDIVSHTNATSLTSVHSAVKIKNCSNLFPRKLVTAILQDAHSRAEACGYVEIELFCQTPVTAVEKADLATVGKRCRVRTERGDILANFVIHATNGYASHIIPHLARKITPVRGQYLAVQPPESFKSRKLWTPSIASHGALNFMFQRPLSRDGLLIIGGGRQAVKDMERGLTDDGATNEDIKAYLLSYLKEYYGGKWKDGESIRVLHEWCGIMGFTESKEPLVGPVLDEDGTIIPGQYISAAYSGHGMTKAPACAEVLVKMMLSEMEQKSWEIPSWFPSEWLTNRMNSVP
ncbi:FAD dependent oxidoreductase [Atractiella rhizophila]|nr:FAD dependent oxidoreductase [Atractiella rhizophila]